MEEIVGPYSSDFFFAIRITVITVESGRLNSDRVRLSEFIA